MCIVFFIFGHPKYKLILASNRDESLKRPTQTADFWDIDENVISAIDLATVTHINKPNKDLNNKKSTKLKRRSNPSTINNYEKQLLDEILKKDSSCSYSSLSESLSKENDFTSDNFEKINNINNIYDTEKKISGYGTWLGCTRQGLFSTLTNFREDPKALKPNAISRGYLVRDFLLLKSLYNKSMNIKQQHSDLSFNEKKKNDTTSSSCKIRMHHPRNLAPEKVLKRFDEEDKLYALEEESKITENMDQKTMVNMDIENEIDFPYEYMKYVNKNKDKYNGFNLIVGDVSLPKPSVWYIGNTDNSTVEKLDKNTVYGISNGSLNTYWKKIERGKKLFARAIESHTDLNDLVHKLLNVLSDKKDVPMDKLPKTAFEPKLEKCCAPICIEKERFNGTMFENDYATRTHTVMIIDNNNHVTFVEQDQYDTISNNYVMKKQCYVFPSSDSSNNTINIPSSYMDESFSSIIHSSSKSTYVDRGMTMPINIPRNRHNSFSTSYGSSIHRTYTNSFASDNPYYFSSLRDQYSFDNLYLNYNTFTNSPISLSSIESITEETLTALSTSNFSSRNNFNSSSPMNSSVNSSYLTLISDINYNSNYMINNEYSSDFDDSSNTSEDNFENNYLEGQIEIMSIESSSSKESSAINTKEQMEKITSYSSYTSITPSVFNFFESLTSNDYNDKPIESQHVKRNVHDLSKANIHQFKLL